MKVSIVFIVILTMLFCSCSNSKPKEINSLVEVTKPINPLDKDVLRQKVMTYCEKLDETVLFDYYRAYNAEFININHEFGAFQNFNIATDSLDEQFNKIPKKQLQAEASVMIENSQDLYKQDKKFGRLYIVGLQFDITSNGQITAYREYLIFWNDKKKGDKTIIIYPKNATKDGSYNYLKNK